METQTNFDYNAAIAELREKIESVKSLDQKRSITKQEFGILLAGIPSIREGNKFTGLELEGLNGEPANTTAVRESLKQKYGIIDKDTAVKAITETNLFGCNWQYQQFRLLWHDSNAIDLSKLGDNARAHFEACMAYAENFRDIVGEKGMLAWDVGECINMIRESVTCGYLDPDMARQMVADFTNQALRTYDNWIDFAIGYVVGGVYFIYAKGGKDPASAKAFYDIVSRQTLALFEDEKTYAWTLYEWFVEKNYFPNMKNEEVEALVQNNFACFVSDRISVDGMPIGLMYKEKPFTNFPDSGWRFFAGDESKEYIADQTKNTIFSMNTICNYDKRVLDYMDSEEDTAYRRNANGDFEVYEELTQLMRQNTKENKHTR